METFHLDIWFSREIDPDHGSSLIMKAERLDASHTLCVFKDRDGVEKIFHSNGEKTCIERADLFLVSHEITHIFRIRMMCSYDEFLNYVHQEADKNVDYSRAQITVNQVIRIIFELLKLSWSWVPIRNRNKKRICDEEMYILARRSDFAWELQEQFDQDEIGLRDWFDFLLKSPKVQKIK